MAERKCIDPRTVAQSGGRATCPDKFYDVFFSKPACGACPKVSNASRMFLGQRMSPGEATAEAIYMKNLLNDLGGRRSSQF